MYWVSGGDAGKFVESVKNAYDRVRTVGSSPLNLIQEEQKVKIKQVITTPAE